MTFVIGEDDFLLDGRPHRILSGAIHYFRVHPDQWADRIDKARRMGLNTIETYVAWNLHAPTPEGWRSGGGLDLGGFLDAVAAAGMHAIVRPGPYICAEWDNGGLPPWLFENRATGIRANEPVYMSAVCDYLRRVYDVVVPRQVDRGGPVVLVQIENEYGAYGDDSSYLEALVSITREAGITVPLTTVDQPDPSMLENGSLPGLHKTASFGSKSKERLATLRRHQGTGPLMCSEYWNGWFDSWGLEHRTSDPSRAADDLDDLLAAGASVNLYMFHGGTNFGLTNGADDKGVYAPVVTSYDYDAPLDESGHPTEKYHAFRAVLARYAPVGDDPPPARPAAPRLAVDLVEATPLMAQLESWPSTVTAALPTFEEVGHHGGFLAHSAALETLDTSVLRLGEVRDRAIVFVDGLRIGVLERNGTLEQLTLPAGKGLTVLVEDLGKVNYGPRLGESKGLMGPVTVDGVPLRSWTSTPVGLDQLQSLATGVQPPRSIQVSAPAMLWGTFELETAADLFLSADGWGKGVAWVNGFCLGRYWDRGPQRTLYVPSPVTRRGSNEVALFEVEALSDSVHFVAEPALDGDTRPRR